MCGMNCLTFLVRYRRIGPELVPPRSAAGVPPSESSALVELLKKGTRKPKGSPSFPVPRSLPALHYSHSLFIRVIMLFATSALALFAAFVPVVFGNVQITDPNNNVACDGGKPCTINWKEGPAAPPLNQSGTCDFYIYTGNPQQQTQLQLLNSTVDVVRVNTLKFVANPKIGPNANVYFIRAQCSVSDPVTPSNPLLAFSGFFTLNKMTGTFSPEALQQISGIPSASLSGGTVSGVSTLPPSGSTSFSATNTPTSTSTNFASSATNMPGGSAASVGFSGAMVVLSGAMFLTQFV
ncbi:hypothetical protein BKA62DRAFT_223737 [Auriculariales sp. MPI-PUGE-AT-0066]|nr:hypothetical protein BKA62DRAFT_223737 [Auriculariales sp. MPI-PUGE-AT-0066]